MREKELGENGAGESRRVDEKNDKNKSAGREELQEPWPVERTRLGAVDVVPPVARELLLIEERAVGAKEGCPLVSLTAVMAHVVRLRTATQRV